MVKRWFVAWAISDSIFVEALCSSAISLQGREKSVRKSSIRAIR